MDNQCTKTDNTSAASISDISDLAAVPEPEDGNESSHDVRLPHSEIYTVRGRSNVFSMFLSSEIEQNDIVGTEYVVC